MDEERRRGDDDVCDDSWTQIDIREKISSAMICIQVGSQSGTGLSKYIVWWASGLDFCILNI